MKMMNANENATWMLKVAVHKNFFSKKEVINEEIVKLN